MYVFGGISKDTILDSFQEFDFTTGEFKDLEKGIIPLHAHACAGFGDRLWIYGGFKSSNQLSNELFEYNFTEKSWKKLEIKGNPIDSLSYHQLFFHEFNLYVCGGTNSISQESKKTFKYNLFTRNCEKIELVDNLVGTKNSHIIKLDESNVLMVQKGNVYTLDKEVGNWENLTFNEIQTKGIGVVCYKRKYLYLFGVINSRIIPHIGRIDIACSLRDFFLSEDLSDITLNLQGHKIPAHKIFLSQAKYFQKDLEKSMDISFDPNLFIKGLRYIYLDTLKVKGEELYHLVNLSRELDYESLEIHLVNQINYLTPNEVINILEKTENNIKETKKERFYSKNHLKNLCIQHYQKNIEKYDSKEIYQRIKNLDKDLRIELLVGSEISQEEFEEFEELSRFIQFRIHLGKYDKLYDSFIISKDEKYPIHKLLFYYNDKLMKLFKDDGFYFQENPHSVKFFSKWIYDPECEDKKFKHILQRYNIEFEGEGFVQSSNILNGEMRRTINKFTNKNGWRLIFQGSRDGFTGKSFHTICDSKGPTVTVIQSENGNIFGGYNPNPWKNSTSYDFSKDTFLFSLKRDADKTPLKLELTGLYHSNTYGAYNNPNYLSTFGGGHDLHICNNCNQSTGSYSNLGYSFSTSDIVYGQISAKNYLAGSYNFKVKEIEVYSLEKK